MAKKKKHNKRKWHKPDMIANSIHEAVRNHFGWVRDDDDGSYFENPEKKEFMQKLIDVLGSGLQSWAIDDAGRDCFYDEIMFMVEFIESLEKLNAEEETSDQGKDVDTN